MSLTDLKQVETGHYIVYVVIIAEYDCPPYSWLFKHEAEAEKAYNILLSYVQTHGNCKREYGRVGKSKELVVFDGKSIHSLKGKTWSVDRLEHCLKKNEFFKSHQGQWQLAIFGLHPKKLRPKWQRFLIQASCTCCYIDQSTIDENGFNAKS